MGISLTERLPLRLRQILDPTKKYMAAVSGGADSLALADALLHGGLRFSVCHVEHGIRGEDSLRDARFVEAFCRERGIPFYLKPVQAIAFSEKHNLSLEAAARQLRYEALFQCAAEDHADFILTAHQKDDQAETFLLRLLRGSGTRGLGAIRFRRDQVLRPLLGFTGEELRDYCRERGLSWQEDITNEDLRYTRNRVRKILLPLLKQNFSPAVIEVLCRTAEHLQTDEEYLEAAASQELKRRLLPDSPEGSTPLVRITAKDWARVSPALRFRVLRQFWQLSGGKKELSGRNLRDMSLLAERGRSGKKILLPDSWQLVYAYGKLILLPPEKTGVFLCYPEGAGEPDNSHCNHDPAGKHIEQPGKSRQPLAENIQPAEGWNCQIPWDTIPSDGSISELFLPDGHRVQLTLCGEKPSYIYRQQAVFPLALARAAGETLTFRYRQGGDRFRPLKGVGHKSLKRFFIDAKVPRELRVRQIIAAAGQEVLWLPGLANAGWKDSAPEAGDISQPESWLFMNLI